MCAVLVVIALPDARATAQRLDREAVRRASEDRVAERALTRAEQAIATGRLARAITMLEQSARRLPRDPRAALRLCEITLPEDDATVDARLEGAQAIRDAAMRCDALLTLAVAQGSATLDRRVADTSAWARALLGDRGPSLARLSSRPLDERDVPALRRLAALAIADGDLLHADTALSLARRVRPSDLELASDLGALRLARGEATSAITLFRSVVAGHPDDRDAVHDLAGAYLQAGEHALAVRLLEQLARADGTAEESARRWVELARARIELGAFADAATDARHALATAPEDDPSPALTLGDALRLAGDARGARAAYEEAVRRDPANLRAQRALAALAETR